MATATTLTFLPASATAAPPASTADVQRRIAALDVKAANAVEEFLLAETELTELERRAAAAQDKARREQERLDAARKAIGEVVAAAYRRGSTDRFVSLLTEGDPQKFLDRAATLDRIARSQADVVADVTTARHRVEVQLASVEREIERAREAREELAERKAQVEAALAEQQRLLAGLRAEQRQQIEAARVSGAPVRASRSGPAATAAAVAPTYNGPAQGRAKAAIEEAHKHLGKPYRYGAEGPDSFDCSGFTSYVWRQVGVSLPRTSRQQYAQGRKVARADIQPGDLVYFGNPIHHVGMYIGDGQMINSPSSGGQVRIQPAFRSDFVGATRPW